MDAGDPDVAWYGGDVKHIHENRRDGSLERGMAAMLVTYDDTGKWALVAPLMDEDLSKHRLPRTVWVHSSSIRALGPK